MKKIAILTSGDGEAASRLVSLFNEGNRVRVELVLSDRAYSKVVNDMIHREVNAVALPRQIWDERPEEVLALLKESGAELLALDGFDGPLPEKIEEEYKGRIVSLTTPDEAPREVVAALSRSEVAKSVDEEWAETLKLNYDPQQARPVPPPLPQQPPVLPHQEGAQVSSVSQGSPTVQSPQVSPVGTTPQTPQEPMPSTWLVWSVLCTVLCCFVPGIVAIVFSSQVSSKYYAGDIEGARKASRNAEIWIIVSFVLGVLSATLYLPIMLVS